MSQLSDNHHDERLANIFSKIGIDNAYKLCHSLQGTIWRASFRDHADDSSCKPKRVVVKVADRYLQQHSLAQIGNKTVSVRENILSEAKLLKFITRNKSCPKSIVQFHKLFRTQHEYFLVMEDGGSSLFDFVVKAHHFIRGGIVELSHWKQVVKVILQQMVECLAYLHSHNICHLDLSLENFVINDVLVEKEEAGKHEKISFVTDHIRVKLCDFGLAEVFEDEGCLCDKYCGKQNYKSPEVVQKNKVFRAKKNDVWCLGVCLFMMSTGSAPWKTASKSDETFVHMTNGFMKGTLKSWDLQNYVDDDLLALFESIFQGESSRISVDEIKTHSWLQ